MHRRGRAMVGRGWHYGRMPRYLARGLATLALIVLVAGCGSKPAAHTASVAPNAAPVAGGTASPAPGSGPSSEPAPGASTSGPTGSEPATDVRRVFPVAGRADYGHTHHDYPATDIFAACGSPVRAAVDGVILEVSRTDRFDINHPLGPDKGGLSISIKGDDGVRYYGAHLSGIAPGIDAGIRVRAGTQLGQVGHTGNASGVCHLHFGLSPLCATTADWWVRRGVVYPWKYLDSWRAGGNLSPVDEVAAWQRDHGCPSAPPAGER
jgi:murein DD-endopeptidase MepM/ murein hydrolase activator NlpD